VTEVQDIHEVKQITKLAFDIIIPILKKRKEIGQFEVSQLLEFLNSEEFKASFGPALKDISELPSEIKDFSLSEGIEFAGFVLAEVKRVVDVYRE
jgi:hypothetical protein